MEIAKPVGRVRRVPGVRRWRRYIAWVAAAVSVAVAAFYGGFGWYFSSELDRSALSGAERRASDSAAPFSLRVVAISDGAITLTVPTEPDVLLQEGTWGLEGQGGGFGQITTVRHREADLITRDYRLLTRTPIAVGEKARLVHQAFPADPFIALGLAFHDVTYDGPLGKYPAWLIDRSPANWAILVHGNGMMRSDVMRLAESVHVSGFTILAITYRNDANAPPDPSGKLRYGLTEWQDLEAAVSFALGRGAHHIVLGGVSMGGGVIVSFLLRSRLAPHVDAVILDSPMLDFGRTVEYGASQRELPLVGGAPPASVVAFAKWVASWRYGVDWHALDYLAGARSLKAPILLFHGTADQTVPIALSEELAAARPDLVTYVSTPGAGHVDSWNLDPARYDGYVETFLSRQLAAWAA